MLVQVARFRLLRSYRRFLGRDLFCAEVCVRTLATVACLSYVGGAQDGGKFCDWVRVYVQRCGAKDLPSRFREGLHRVNEDNYRNLCSDLRASNRAGRACFEIDDRFVSCRQAAAIC